MDSKKFIESALSPEEWLGCARLLRRSSQKLFQAVGQVLKVHATDESTMEPDAYERVLGYMLHTEMLRGMCVECALKALLLLEFPERVQLKVTMDGRGSFVDVVVNEFGGIPSHGLEKLAEVCGLIRSKKDMELRAFLRHLEDRVVWSARYPVPLKLRALGDVGSRVSGKEQALGERFIDQLFERVEEGVRKASRTREVGSGNNGNGA